MPVVLRFVLRAASQVPFYLPAIAVPRELTSYSI